MKVKLKANVDTKHFSSCFPIFGYCTVLQTVINYNGVIFHMEDMNENIGLQG